MGRECGKSIVTLVILTILIMIGASVIINYAKQMMEKTKEQDLKTNMLLIQARTKKGVEDVCFQIVNLDKTKEENIAKINEAKQEYLVGTMLANSPEEVQEAAKNVPDVELDENCYYLDENVLKEIGIKNVNTEEYGYFIVKYDFSKTSVEVINTKGHQGNHTLTQILQAISEENS